MDASGSLGKAFFIKIFLKLKKSINILVKNLQNLDHDIKLGGDPRSCLGRVFNSKLGRIAKPLHV